MQKISFLLIGTSLYLIPTITFAQCVATQDCATLGYTETSCNGGKGIKCPFGNTFACTGGSSEITPEQCTQLGFTHTCTGTGEKGVGNACNGKYQGCSCDSIYQYTCSGTGYSGGSGTTCSGKYVACTCAIGYEWKDGSCQKQVLNGAQGELYYCNGTVIGVRATGMDFYVTMQDLGAMTWSNANSQCQKYVFCGSLKGSLPTRAQLLTIYNNKSSVNSLLSTNGGTQLTTNTFYWSSSDYSGSSGDYYVVSVSNGKVDTYLGSRYSYYVRPILTSW